MKKIINFVTIEAAPERVYEALTTQAGLAGWWSTKVQVEPGQGGLVRFRFVDDFHPQMRVTALAPDRRVAWTCEAGHPNWQDNTFSFELDPRGGGTGLMFVQVYAQELGDEVYGVYNFNWGYYLESLRRLCETGKGVPFQAS